MPDAMGCDVVIDAAPVGLCGAFSLRDHPVEFVACSFCKLFGLPTGVGALVAKKTALARFGGRGLRAARCNSSRSRIAVTR